MTRDTALHRIILISILKDFFQNASLAPFLGFKGGTAAMLFYELPRFSVDLDFDLLGAPDEEYILSLIKEVLEKYGTVKKLHNKRNALKGASNIKVEINKRMLKAQYHVMSYLGIPMRVMVKEDMIAHKLMAMYNRLGHANRDIFDVWFFMKSRWSVHEQPIVDAMKMPYSEFLQHCIEALEKFDDHTILTGLGELLTVQQRTWVQNRLKQETLFQLRLALSSLEKAGNFF